MLRIDYDMMVSEAVERAAKTGDPEAVEICRKDMETSIRVAAMDAEDRRFTRRMRRAGWGG